MKIYLSFLLLFTLVSCGSAPTIEDTTQRSPVFIYSEDGKYIDVSKSYCICRKYRYNIEYVGTVGGSWQEPIKNCNKVVGWNTKEYVTVAEYWVRVKEYLNDIMREHGY